MRREIRSYHPDSDKKSVAVDSYAPGEKIVVYEFDSFDEYLDQCENAPRLRQEKYTDPKTKKSAYKPLASYGSDWGTAPHKKSLELARNGSKNSIQGIEEWSNLLLADISTRLPKPELIFDKIGNTWDLERVMTNDPECWINEEPGIDLDRDHRGNIVRIVINTASSAGHIGSNNHQYRCSAVAALASLLEKCGFFVQIEITTALNMHCETGRLEFRTIAKYPHEALNVAALAYWASSEMEHRIDFGICETLPECHGGNTKPSEHHTNYGYGISTSDKGDITFDTLNGFYPHGGSFDNAKQQMTQWIIQQLGKQGVVLDDQGDAVQVFASVSDED